MCVTEALEGDRQRRAQIRVHAKQGWNLDRLASYISGMAGIQSSETKHRSGNAAVVDVRKALACLGHGKLEVLTWEIADHLRVTASAVPPMLEEGKGVERCRML